jgi:hypothetical protein
LLNKRIIYIIYKNKQREKAPKYLLSFNITHLHVLLYDDIRKMEEDKKKYIDY